MEDDEEAGCSLRATYIIDDKGIVRHFTIGDIPVGRNSAETFRLVSAFQHYDKHGEMCPASWQPGNVGLRPENGK